MSYNAFTMKKIDFAKELNNAQYEVVTAGPGAHLVLAGAGSGKTRTLVYRVAWLISQGVAPEKILLLTFTNKAAREMMERVQHILAYTAKDKVNLWGGTFHSVANRLLKQYGQSVGLAPQFTILDSDDSEKLIKTISKELWPEAKKGGKPSPGAIKEVISFATNAKISLEESLDTKYPEWLEDLASIDQIAKEYQRRKTLSQVLDFDDLLVYWLKLTQDKDIIKKFGAKWEHVLVDEYQDTNTIQDEIVYNLGQAIKNIVAVGDDAQSIYSFRAADVKNILKFPEQFTNCQIHKLETNYRSTPEILAVANNVLIHHDKRFAKKLEAVKSSYRNPYLLALASQQEEAWAVAERISNLIQSGVKPQDIAVLFRASSHSQQLEMELNRRGIDYEMRGGLRFFERAHIKDVLSFLKILANYRDEMSWRRIMQMNEGIGPITAQQIYNRLQEMDNFDQLFESPLRLAEKAGQSWTRLIDFLQKLHQLKFKRVGELVNLILEYYEAYLEETYPDYKQRRDDLEELMLFANNYDNLDLFINEVSLQESYGLKNSRHTNDRVVLSTVHQAKGLEWAAVFVINLTDQAFPHPLCKGEEEQAEERRLFYVAITRAEKFLFLSYPLASFRYDGQRSFKPSIFVTDISSNLLEQNDLARATSQMDDDVVYEVEGDDRGKSDGYLPDISSW